MTETKCIECGKMTTGSYGPTGVFWSFLCQPCKDKADQQSNRQMMILNQAFDKIFQVKK